jgi:metal-responsive CopG/Arc/MetJ family transcriptional regulator
MRGTSFKIEEDLLEQLDRYAQKYGLNRSEALRKMIKEVTEKEFKNETIPIAKIEKLHL